MDILSLGRIGRRVRALIADLTRATGSGGNPPSSTRPGSSSRSADEVGLLPFVGERGLSRNGFVGALRERRSIQARIHGAEVPFMVIDPNPGLRIIDANRQYAAITLADRREMRGRKLFEFFPDNPDDPAANGVEKLYTSLCRATQTGQSHGMDTQRYDVVGADGEFVEKYWSPINTPIYDENGGLLYLLHHARDVTADVLKARASRR